jgi:hypothetical protein
LSLTIVLPVKDTPSIVSQFIQHHGNLLRKYSSIVIDSGGGQELQNYASTYLQINEPLHLARRRGIDLATSEFTLNLDVDALIPLAYPMQAMRLLQRVRDVVAVALDYEYPKRQGHLAFGTCLARSDALKLTYDWVPGRGSCECLYMWPRLRRYGYLETLPLGVKHLGPHKYRGPSIVTRS